MLKKLFILKTGYTPEDAVHAIVNTDGRVRVADVKEIYYPYRLIKYDLSVGKEGAFSKLTKKANCIVDLVVGRPAEGRGNPKYEEIKVDEELILEEKIDDEKARNMGYDFVLKLFLNKARLLHTPRIQVTEEKHFHKKFYIVRCLDKDDLDYFIMVDAIDGGLVILDDE